MIPQDTVNQILQTADIAEVVGEFVNLKKRGANLMACCPFHNEKSPSFSVSPAKGIYKCFGCGKGGDVVRFLMDLEGMSYPESLKWLARKYNIEVVEKILTDTEMEAQNERESLFIVSEFAQNHFHKNLLETEEGQSIGLSYFTERGFSKPVIEKFNLGYAFTARETLYQEAKKAGFSENVLDKAGLIHIREDGGIADRFWGRVIFPIHNLAGKPIAFGARILNKEAKAAKYINSPETEIYHKSNIVYGIYQAKNAIRQKENCYLVEGYIDVISLHQAGIENVVASSGTSLTPEQIKLIGRFTENVTVLYDSDAAGINASLRGIDLILEEGLNVKAVIFPDGDDPDSYIRKVGGEAFQQYVQTHQKDFIRLKTELSLNDIGEDAVKKAELIDQLVTSITRIPDPIKRQLFYQQVAELLHVDEHILINEGNKRIAINLKGASKPGFGTPAPAAPARNLEQEFLDGNKSTDEDALIKDLVIYGRYPVEDTDKSVIVADFIFNDVDESILTNPILRKIYQQYKEFYSKGETPPHNFFTSNPDTAIQDLAVLWESSNREASEGWMKYEVRIPSYSEKLGEIISKTIFRIYLLKIKKEIEDLGEKLETVEDEDEQDMLLAAIQDKTKHKQLIAKELGAVF